MATITAPFFNKTAKNKKWYFPGEQVSGAVAKKAIEAGCAQKGSDDDKSTETTKS